MIFPVKQSSYINSIDMFRQRNGVNNSFRLILYYLFAVQLLSFAVFCDVVLAGNLEDMRISAEISRKDTVFRDDSNHIRTGNVTNIVIDGNISDKISVENDINVIAGSIGKINSGKISGNVKIGGVFIQGAASNSCSRTSIGNYVGNYEGNCGDSVVIGSVGRVLPSDGNELSVGLTKKQCQNLINNFENMKNESAEKFRDLYESCIGIRDDNK
ncbi:MAG: hypothetical protein P1U37_15795 [Minwuia sp.]|nr:hypothetical protein [Minwuia sp.]